MSESILVSTKKLLGVAAEDKSFDVDIIMHINSVFSDLAQLGVGPAQGFAIEDDSTQWVDFLAGDLNFNSVKSYMYQSVRLKFDPPASGFALDALKEQISKAEFRLNIHAEGETWVPPITAPPLESDPIW